MSDSESKQGHKKTHAAITGKGSPIQKYQNVVVGSSSILKLVYFELCAWMAVIPGALGLVLRQVFWPRLFLRCGKGVQFAKGITLRHPGRIAIGAQTVISEGVILDARNADVDEAITLGSHVMLANDVYLSAKGGTIAIGDYTGVGAQTVIQSTNNCPTQIGRDVIVGPQCYLVGGGSYRIDDLAVPMWQQGIKPDGGCLIDDNVWLGGKVTVLGDAPMAKGSVAAAGAVVNQPVAENAIVGGVPARYIKSRTELVES